MMYYGTESAFENPFKENAKYAIVYLDEIDKISKGSGIDDFGEGLQNELIGYIENSDLFNGQLTTKNMLFIGTGAFVGLDKIVEKRCNSSSSIGFNSSSKKLDNKYNTENLLQNVTNDDLIEYGMKPELVGRFPLTSSMDKLNENSLLAIMDLKTSYLTKQKKLLKKIYNINLEFTNDAKSEIAKSSIALGTGARALQSLISQTLHYTHFYAEDNRNKKIIIDSKNVKKSLKF